MMDQIKQPHRWLALGLLLLVVSLMSGLIIVPLLSLGMEYREQRQAIIFNLRRYQKILNKKESLIQNLQTLTQKYNEQNYFYSRPTIALASADLQAFISGVITSAGGQVIRKSSSSKPLEDNFTRIIIDVSMTVTIEALRAILYEIETVTPLIIIDQIRVKSAPKRRNPKTRKLESGDQLTINFKVSSFVDTH